jgi:hypothetical protein
MLAPGVEATPVVLRAIKRAVVSVAHHLHSMPVKYKWCSTDTVAGFNIFCECLARGCCLFQLDCVTSTYWLSLWTPWRHMEDGGTDPLIISLDTRWKWAVSLTLRPLYDRQKRPPPPPLLPQHLFIMRLFRPRNRSGRCKEGDNPLSLPGIEPQHISVTNLHTCKHCVRSSRLTCLGGMFYRLSPWNLKG